MKTFLLFFEARTSFSLMYKYFMHKKTRPYEFVVQKDEICISCYHLKFVSNSHYLPLQVRLINKECVNLSLPKIFTFSFTNDTLARDYGVLLRRSLLCLSVRSSKRYSHFLSMSLSSTGIFLFGIKTATLSYHSFYLKLFNFI